MTNFVSTHWGTYETSKKDGNDIKINKWSKDPDPSNFGLGFLEAARSDLRIDQPYIRKEWLQNRDNKSNNGQRPCAQRSSPFLLSSKRGD